ncbi:peptide-methionine (R)-S-oxide reductase MsrB [Micromonospora marina]|uniref:peptide-methionine (R)-S-oxide reductase MsrB n=1 Tax=Micromonospora marina TaxID=307120 RepID=UPI0035EBF47A
MRCHRHPTYRGTVSPSDNDLPRTEDEWRVRLSPEEFRVLREAGTEAPWTGEYVDTRTPGVYHCRACGLELFRSQDKFDSHCGWPSFDDAIPGAVKEIPDNTLGMRRVEIRCARCDSHLGHVFEGEGFTPKDTRHCVNSISVRLEPSAG